VTFEQELIEYLPADLPNREACIAGAARHLELIADENQRFNLTRIVSPREAAIKHVVDSIMPWRLFADARQIVDAGSGAGFPGIPLALVLPAAGFTLLESTQKKARFLKTAAGVLGLGNVEVFPERAETWLKTRSADVITARAVAPVDRALELFAPALRRGARVLLYKGPDAERELAEAGDHKWRARIVYAYELPGELGSRRIIEISGAA
jgi:16S rRNA (guanine527-N7)-methyltransferase